MEASVLLFTGLLICFILMKISLSGNMETQSQGVKGACKQFNLDNTLIGALCQVTLSMQMQLVKNIKLPCLDNPTES